MHLSYSKRIHIRNIQIVSNESLSLVMIDWFINSIKNILSVFLVYHSDQFLLVKEAEVTVENHRPLAWNLAILVNTTRGVQTYNLSDYRVVVPADELLRPLYIMMFSLKKNMHSTQKNPTHTQKEPEQRFFACFKANSVVNDW